MQKIKILIASHSQMFGHALSLLRHQNHELTLVMDGTDALSHLRAGDIDFCLLQDRLPNLSGLDVCEQWSYPFPPRQIPIIIFSHQAEIENLAREKGASGFLKVPCRSQQLLELVETWGVKRTRILLVDDSQLVHGSIGEFLKGNDFELIQAFDGEAGIQKAIQFTPSLIITDIDMPQLDGYELCRRSKGTKSTEHIPVIMLSARSSGIDIDKGFDVGANDFLIKPVNVDELLSRIHLILGSDDTDLGIKFLVSRPDRFWKPVRSNESIWEIKNRNRYEIRTREKILIVDDSKLHQNLMSQGLSQQGFEVVTAQNGQEALELARQQKPDIVITDLEMPIMNGRDFCRELRKRDLLKEVPVIMLTGRDSELDRVKGEHAGVSAYLSKPFPPDKLVVLVEKLIAERRWVRERRLLETDNARKTKELENARKLQLAMLPRTPPTLPNLDIAFDMETATEVGGDYYDFNLATDGTLTIAIGDATGHGLSAGIIVVATKSLFKASANEPDNLRVLEKISQSLRSMNLRRLYMAMTLVRFKDGQITVAAAGMPPVFIYRAAAQSVEEVLLEGMPLGCSIKSQYQQKTFELQPGDTVLLTSDGLPEMLNPEEEILDYPRTKVLFEAVADKMPEEIIEHLFKGGEAWANGRPQDDDVTFVVMKVK
ncbi:response regulator [Candidatus Poribacteria bacterium]|nr:response regulator [Candidatus Poribacteria bacterium]